MSVPPKLSLKQRHAVGGVSKTPGASEALGAAESPNEMVASPLGEGGFTAEGAGEAEGSLNWGNQDTLEKHYKDHGSDFGSSSPEEYAQSAHDFYLNRGEYEVKVDSSGVTRVYDPATNTFGSYNPDGTTRTFYKPTAGQGYFDRQPGS